MLQNPKELTFEDRDEFKRQPFAEQLIKLISSEHNFFPLAITGQWGTGKTEFCKKTVHLINKKYANNLTVEYLNAFSEDSYNDPLFSITSTICRTFIQNDSKREKYFERFVKTLIPLFGIAVIKSFCPPAADIIKSAQDAIERFNKENVKQNLENRAQIDSSIKNLKDLIEEISDGKPFVLFIDELDRCKPDFALRTLEVVKHIFDTENLKIIFVINKEQLVEIIKHSYGNNEETAEKYLDKFFQTQLKLPEFSKSQNQQVQNSITYLNKLFRDNKIFDLPLFNTDRDSSKQKENSDPANLLKELSVHYNLSLRDVEKLTKYILIYSITHPLNHDLPAFALIEAYAIFHFTFNKKAFQNFKTRRPILEGCGDLFVPDSEIGLTTPARVKLHQFLYDADDSRFYYYTGNSSVEDRNKFLKDILFNLDNLLLQ